MATYKGVKGFTIQTIAGDPPAPQLGQVWYNTTSNVLKGYVTTTEGWSTSTALPVGTADMGSGGTTTAAIIWGGTPFDNVGNDTDSLIIFNISDDETSSINLLFLSNTPSTLVIKSSRLDFSDLAIAPEAVSPFIL